MLESKQWYQLSQGKLYYSIADMGKNRNPLELMAFLSYVNTFHQITQEGSSR